MLNNDTLEFLIDITKDLPKLLKMTTSDGAELKWGNL